MESEARYTIVGATIVALVIATIGAVLWLKSSGSRERVDRYTIYFQRQSLDGLQVGADVTMLGISVGKVESVAVDARTMNRVRLTVRVLALTPVTPATTAVVQRNLLTGIARIALTPPGEPNPTLLSAVAAGEQYPVIAEGRSDLDQIADAANRMAKSGAIALDNLNEVMSPDNRAAFGQTLANVRDLTTALTARVDRIDEVVVALTRTASDVGRATRDFGESVRQMRGAALPAAAQAESTLRDVSRAVERLERETVAVAQRVDTALEVGSLEFEATTRELRSTAQIVARTVDRLRDPRTALFGPAETQFGPGEGRE